MGLAASQARFLTLTARKSNIEFQGQQINQQRTVLANKSADVVNKMLALKPPTPPSSTSSEYYKVSQSFVNEGNGTYSDGSNVNGKSSKITSWKMVDANDHSKDPSATTTSVCYEVNYTYMKDGVATPAKMYTSVTGFTVGSDGLKAAMATAIDKMSLQGIFKTDDQTGDIVEKMRIANDQSFTGGTGTSDYDASELIYGTNFNDLKYNESMNQYDFDKYTYEKAISDINAETSEIQSKDKALELKLKQLDSEHGAIQTELDAVKNVITKNIEGTFKTFA